VLEASGTGKSQMYHYFGGKSDLVRAVAAHQAEQTLIGQSATWRRCGPSRTCGSGSISRCPPTPASPRPGALWGPLAMEMVNEPGSTRAAVADAFSRWRDALQDALGRLQRRGLVRERWTPPQRADILLAAYEGGVLLSGVHGGTGALRLALVAAVEAMLVEGRRAGDPARADRR